MTGCPLGYGSPENSIDLQVRASKVELPKNYVLSTSRVVSTIPNRDGNWAYPSEEQFYRNAVAKGHSVDPVDMEAVVGIHNAVNEETWRRIVEIENRLHHAICPAGPKLVRFVGKPGETSLKAQLKHSLGGFVLPFDRHEWTIDRCGTGQFKYDVDFYDGPRDPSGKVNIFIDARPKLNTFAGLFDTLRSSFHSVFR